jgi:hypothetical protein
MDKKNQIILRSFFLLLTLEGMLASLLLIWMRLPSGNEWLEGYSAARLLLWAAALAALSLSAWITYKAFSDLTWLDKTGALIQRLAQDTRFTNVFVACFFILFLQCLAAFSGIPQEPLPRFLYLFEIALARTSPLLIWMSLAALQALGLIFLVYPAGRAYLVKAVLVGALTSILFVLYWLGGVGQLVEANDRSGATDQNAYMEYARRLYETGYKYPGDFNRMPLFPFIQSLLYSSDMSGQDFFRQGKYLSLVLSVLFLGVLAFIFSRYFRPLHTLNLMLIITFLVFIFKAGFFQAELLFYFLNFCLFWCLWRLLHRPSILIAILAGLLAGLAHLTKASILPGLVLFLIFTLLKGIWVLVQQRRAGQVAAAGQPARVYFVVVPVVALVFLASVFPYIQTAKRITGHYFYNVNSTFYMWYDNWNQAVRGTKAHGDRSGWPDMPPEKIPSMSKYLSEHNQEQILHRITNGSRKVIKAMRNSFGYLEYLEAYLVFFSLAGVVYWRRAWKIFAADPVPLLFYLAYFVVYFLLYAWYVPIATGSRLVLAQVMPLLFVVSLGLHTLLFDSKLKLRRFSIHTLDAANLVLLVFLVFEIYRVLTFRVWVMYGGS